MKTLNATDEQPDPYEMYRRIWRQNIDKIAFGFRKSLKFGGRR